MPRDYKNSINKTEEPTSSPNALLTFAIGLAAGLIVTAAVFFNISSNQKTDEPIAQPTEAEEEIVTVETEPEKVSLSELAEKENLEEPTYEFYKILPNLKINVSEWEETQIPVQESQTTKSTENLVYVLQVGSFQKMEMADRVKAKLALMGISADIQRVVINGQDVFHRVRVGPYKDAQKLEQVKTNLINNNMPFDLLKLSVDQ